MDYKQTDRNGTKIATWENGFIVKQDNRDFDLSINMELRQGSQYLGRCHKKTVWSCKYPCVNCNKSSRMTNLLPLYTENDVWTCVCVFFMLLRWSRRLRRWCRSLQTRRTTRAPRSRTCPCSPRTFTLWSAPAPTPATRTVSISNGYNETVNNRKPFMLLGEVRQQCFFTLCWHLMVI